MTDAILVNGVTPQQLTETILKGVETQIDDLKKNFTTKDIDSFLTRAEVSELLKINLATVYNWTKNGTLKAYKMGNRTYYSRKEIEETLFNSNKTE